MSRVSKVFFAALLMPVIPLPATLEVACDIVMIVARKNQLKPKQNFPIFFI